MVQMTLEVSEELAERLRPLGAWLPTVLELSLLGLKTVAAATASEVIAFLSQDPTPQEVLRYHVSESAQQHLQRLLALNAAGRLGEAEHQELDELQRIEHLVVMLKAQVLQGDIAVLQEAFPHLHVDHKVMAFCTQHRLFDALSTVMHLLQCYFHKIQKALLQLEQDPESGEEKLIVDITLHGDIDEVLASYDTYTRQWVDAVPWPQRDYFRLSYDVI